MALFDRRIEDVDVDLNDRADALAGHDRQPNAPQNKTRNTAPLIHYCRELARAVFPGWLAPFGLGYGQRLGPETPKAPSCEAGGFMGCLGAGTGSDQTLTVLPVAFAA